MKTILLCIIALIFFISCSADSELEAADPLSIRTTRMEADRNYPGNLANPFDVKGKKIYEALKQYYLGQQSPNSISELAGQIRFISEQLDRKGGITGKLIPFTDELVESIMNDPDNSMILIVQNSILQQYAKTSLIDFLEQLILERQQEFALTYNYILSYESAVLNDTGFTSEETETILTVASISRYSLYSEQERKDRDWEVIVGGRQAKPFFAPNEAAIVSIIALLDGII
jgi:hypothetical protein